MVKRFIDVLHKEISGLHRAAYLLAFFSFLSQILALVRDRLLAHYFGAGTVLDLYYAAFRIPDFLFVSLGSMVSISVLVPFFIDRMAKSDNDGRRVIDEVFTFFSVLMVGAAVCTYFLAPYIIPRIFSGLQVTADMAELISYTRLLLWSPILLGVSNFFASITQASRRFTAYALSPVLYNAGIIFGIIVLLPYFGLRGVLYGVIFGAVLHIGCQIPVLARDKFIPRITRIANYSAVRSIFILSIPRTLALAASNLTALVLIAMASHMEQGSIAIFNLSLNLQSVPLTLVGVSYSIAAFPALASLFSSGKKSLFLEDIISASRHIIFWALPISVLFIVLRAQIVRTILGSGAFSWEDTRLTAAALALFAISAVAQSLILLFVRGFYAAGKTKMPLLINTFSSLLIVVLAYLFLFISKSYAPITDALEWLLRVSGIDGTAVLALPLPFTIGSIVNAILLWVSFERAFGSIFGRIHRMIFEISLASIVVGAVSYVSLDIFDDIFNIDTALGIFSQGLFSGIFGILFGVVILLSLRNRELSDIFTTLSERYKKIPPAL